MSIKSKSINKKEKSYQNKIFFFFHFSFNLALKINSIYNLSTTKSPRKYL